MNPIILTSALDGDDWSVSRPCTYRRLDVPRTTKEEKIRLTLVEIELKSSGIQPVPHSLYRLNHSGHVYAHRNKIERKKKERKKVRKTELKNEIMKEKRKKERKKEGKRKE